MTEGIAATHEAGHVVVLLAVGVEIDRVEVDPFGNSGATIPSATFLDALSSTAPARADVARACVFLVAGKAYEELLEGRGADPILLTRGHIQSMVPEEPDDARSLFHFVDKITTDEEERRQLVALFTQRALGIEERNSRGARAISDALRKRGSLTGIEARAVWAGQGGRKESRTWTDDLVVEVGDLLRWPDWHC